MTECERLIKEGSLPIDFLEPEERNGVSITTENKKLWAIQIDLAMQIDKLCENHHLRYYMIGGTLLGAVRHKGYIPWDDDLDIAMFRADYDKFVNLAQKELKAPYFLQSPLTDRGFFRHHVVLRNSNTTCIGKWEQHAKNNNGIYVDIFPLDDYVDNELCNDFIRIARRQNMIGMNNYRWRSAKNAKLKRMLLLLGGAIMYPGGSPSIYQKHEAMCLKISREEYDRIGLQYTNFFYPSHKLIWERKLFSDTVRMPYEYTDFCAPAGFDMILRTQYGDYMQFPPVEKRGDKHSFEYDADTPYREYCAKKYGTRYT